MTYFTGSIGLQETQETLQIQDCSRKCLTSLKTTYSHLGQWQPTNDFTKTINHQNLHSSILTSNIVQKSSLGFSTNLAFPNSSNDNLGVFQKNNSGFKKERQILVFSQLVNLERSIRPQEIPFKHPIKQVINNVNKLPGANINEEVSKKTKTFSYYLRCQ